MQLKSLPKKILYGLCLKDIFYIKKNPLFVSLLLQLEYLLDSLTVSIINILLYAGICIKSLDVIYLLHKNLHQFNSNPSNS